MKFFKHFTDSHEGSTLTSLFKQMGHMGPSCYWTLVEICAEKLEKEESEEYTEAHCHFRFHESILRKKLRVSSKNLQKFLRICSELSVVFSTFSQDIVEIEMPKLLECLDRDARRARPERGPSAPKRKSKRKNKEADIANLNWREAASSILAALARYGDWAKGEAEVREELGDTVFELARRAGIHKMRMLPGNQYAVPTVMGMLKEATNQTRMIAEGL